MTSSASLGPPLNCSCASIVPASVQRQCGATYSRRDAQPSASLRSSSRCAGPRRVPGAGQNSRWLVGKEPMEWVGVRPIRYLFRASAVICRSERSRKRFRRHDLAAGACPRHFERDVPLRASGHGCEHCQAAAIERAEFEPRRRATRRRRIQVVAQTLAGARAARSRSATRSTPAMFTGDVHRQRATLPCCLAASARRSDRLSIAPNCPGPGPSARSPYNCSAIT
jgi:hypothetical protein